MKQAYTSHALLRCSALACLAIAAVAAPGAASGALPCAADIQKFCADVPTGSGRVEECLEKHAKELSPECKTRHENLQKEMGTLAATCREDISQFCSDVVPGSGRIAACLQNRSDDLSPVCKDAFRKASKPASK
jgi:Golgi apparatus protein 1